MKRYLWILTIALPTVCAAQAARVALPDFRELEAKASESINISLDGEMLKSAGGLMGGGRGDPARDAEASAGDIEPVLRQAQAPGWKSLMSIRDEEDRVELWMRAGTADGGMLLVVTEPDELVIVNIVGKIDLEKLRKMQGRMGVPYLPGYLGRAPGHAPPPPVPPAKP